MKKAFKFSYMVILSLMAFAISSCTSDYDYTGAPKVANEVFFSNTQESKIELSKSNSSFVITLHQYCIGPRCNHILNAGPDYQPDYCSKCGQHVNCSDVPWEEEVQLGYVRKEERCE